MVTTPSHVLAVNIFGGCFGVVEASFALMSSKVSFSSSTRTSSKSKVAALIFYCYSLYFIILRVKDNRQEEDVK